MITTHAPLAPTAYPLPAPPTRSERLHSGAILAMIYSLLTGLMFALGWLNALWVPDVMLLLMIAAIGLAFPLLAIAVFAFVVMNTHPSERERGTAWMAAIALAGQFPIAAVLILMVGSR